MQRVFLDTNIVVDFLGERLNFYAEKITMQRNTGVLYNPFLECSSKTPNRVLKAMEKLATLL